MKWVVGMVSDPRADKPTYDEYVYWYERRFLVDLEDGGAEAWYDRVTVHGLEALHHSSFWTQLLENLRDWNADFRLHHDGYQLLDMSPQPTRINRKSFKSAINKAYRWNVLDNDNWPNPPERAPSTAVDLPERQGDIDDERRWFGPHNWLQDFRDIFRMRLVAKYFDGVKFLAERIKALAETTTSGPPELEYKASLDGYHAAHVLVNHELEATHYQTNDPVQVKSKLEIQVTTTMQATINSMLHRIYEDWRLNGPPRDWEWDEESPAFSVNYLGNTLHYLEGQIVLTRNGRGRS